MIRLKTLVFLTVLFTCLSLTTVANSTVHTMNNRDCFNSVKDHHLKYFVRHSLSAFGIIVILMYQIIWFGAFFENKNTLKIAHYVLCLLLIFTILSASMTIIIFASQKEFPATTAGEGMAGLDVNVDDHDEFIEFQDDDDDCLNVNLRNYFLNNEELLDEDKFCMDPENDTVVPDISLEQEMPCETKFLMHYTVLALMEILSIIAESHIFNILVRNKKKIKRLQTKINSYQTGSPLENPSSIREDKKPKKVAKKKNKDREKRRHRKK